MTKRRYYEPYYYPRYTPSKPRPVDGGISLKSERGEITKHWWSKRWIEALEQFTITSRLSRGKTYARAGQVVSLDITGGKASAKVQGSRTTPYSVTIEVALLSPAQWDKVIAIMGDRALFSAKLLSGEMPSSIEDAFTEAKVPLFPAGKNELRTTCSCPDFANPCKHVAAVHYILAERFDEDPFLMFELRGRLKDEICDAMRARRAMEPVLDDGSNARPASIMSREGTNQNELERHENTTFWGSKDNVPEIAVCLRPPAVPRAMFRSLGQSHMSIGGRPLEEILTPVYDMVSRFVMHRFIEGSTREDKTGGDDTSVLISSMGVSNANHELKKHLPELDGHEEVFLLAMIAASKNKRKKNTITRSTLGKKLPTSASISSLDALFSASDSTYHSIDTRGNPTFILKEAGQDFLERNRHRILP